MEWSRNDNRRMCPNCRAFITTSDKVCPYCDMPIGARAVDRRAAADAMAGFLEGDRFLTNVILVINVGLFLATLAYSSDSRHIAMDPSAQALYAFGWKDGFAILRGGQWWRLITAGWLHGGFFHILMNGYALWQFGPLVDAVFGTYRYISIYIVAGLAGFAASVYWDPINPSVGASAAISGLIGAMIGLGLREHNSAIGREMKRFVPVAVIVLAQGFLLPLPIDNAAHIGGFTGGAVVAFLSGSKAHIRAGEDLTWKTIAAVCIAITMYAFFRMLQFMLSR